VQLFRPQSGFTLLELLVVIAIISILAMVALPTYMDYITRTRIIEDFGTVDTVKIQIVEYYMLNGELPTKNEQLGLGKDKTINGIRLEKVKIDKNPMPGTIKIYYDKNNDLLRIGKDNSIEFVPVPRNGVLVWECTSGSLADKFRPANCRGESEFDKDGKDGKDGKDK